MPNALSVADIVQRHSERKGPLLPILHDVQAMYGFVSNETVRQIAGHLNLTRAEVHGVLSFYHDFLAAPEVRPVLKLCRAEACQARGSETLAAELSEIGAVKIEPVYCLGLCSVGPNALVGDQVHARLDTGKLAALVESMA